MPAMNKARFIKSLRVAAVVPALCLSLGLAGCYTSYSDDVPGISYQNAAPVKVTAGRIEISNAYNATMTVPYVEHMFRVTPAAAAQELVRRQIVATEGNPQVLRVIVEDASVRQTIQPKADGVAGMVKRAPDEKFDSRIALRFELAEQAAPDVIIGRAQVVATRERTLRGGATLAERDREYQDLTQALVNDLSQGISTTVQNTFGYK